MYKTNKTTNLLIITERANSKYLTGMVFILLNWPLLCKLNFMHTKLMIQLEWGRYDKDTCDVRSNHAGNVMNIMKIYATTLLHQNL